jgi:RIMS-binding protein 2
MIIAFVWQIIGEKDADGFYWGECGNRSGYVPCNMVSEVQVRPPIIGT